MSAAGWAQLVPQLALLSLLQIGGAIAIAPDLHRLVVEKLALLTTPQLAASIAIAQASPGPNVLYVSVIGYQLAGLGGAILFLACILVPSSVLAIAMGRWGHARREERSLLAFKAGMAPISIALLLATSWIVVAQAPGWRPAAIAAAAALLVWRTRVHILWLIAAGAAVGALGWL